ncbi:MAG: hypothetical protein ACOYM2_04420 [Rectinemataceae bacterium]
MRIKLDENMPTSLAAQLNFLGHDVHTVRPEIDRDFQFLERPIVLKGESLKLGDALMKIIRYVFEAEFANVPT